MNTVRQFGIAFSLILLNLSRVYRTTSLESSIKPHYTPKISPVVLKWKFTCLKQKWFFMEPLMKKQRTFSTTQSTGWNHWWQKTVLFPLVYTESTKRSKRSPRVCYCFLSTLNKWTLLKANMKSSSTITSPEFQLDDVNRRVWCGHCHFNFDNCFQP